MPIKPTKKELFQLAKTFIPNNIPLKNRAKGMMTYTIGIAGNEYKVTYLKDHDDAWYVYEIVNADGSLIDDPGY
jgi:hypothetical protein